LFERVGYRDLFERQRGDIVDRPQWATLPIESVDIADRVDSGPRPVLTAHERRAGRLTVGTASVAVREPHTVGGELVDVGRFVVFASLAAEIGPTQVVGQNKYDIGPTGISCNKACSA